MEKLSLHLLCLLLLVGISVQALSAQQPTQKDEQNPIYQEIPDDPYIPIDRSTQATSPPYSDTRGDIWTVQVNVDENGGNIVGDAANEPSIAVDPTNPFRMAIGWRQFDDINNNFRQAGYAYTNNGGESWVFPNVIEPGIFRSDPVLDFTSEGKFYYNSLTNVTGDYACDVYTSYTENDWGEKTYAYGGDKQWTAVDRTEGSSNGNVYASWKDYLSACPPAEFTRSTDDGQSYDACAVIPNGIQRGTMSVGPDGTVYVFGQDDNGFRIAISENAKETGSIIDWTTSTVDLGGPIGLYDGPNPSGMLAQAWVATDHSFSDTHGNVYALCSVFPSNSSDPLEVMFSRSVDGGLSWSTPTRINDDENGNWQWFGTMSVAPNGRIDIVWLDTRLDPGGVGSALYYSYSMDGGLSWSLNKQMSEVFDPHLGWPSQQKMGDYFHMISTVDGAHLAWAATFNEEQDVYYSYITPEVMTSTISVDRTEDRLQVRPNPFNEVLQLQYELAVAGRVQLSLVNTAGQLVAQVLDEYQNEGIYTANFEGEIPSGLYFCKLLVDGQLVAIKKVVNRAYAE